MEKKIISVVISAIMALSVVLFAVSCGASSQTTTSATEKEETTETTTIAVTEEVTTEPETTEEVTTELTGYEKLQGYEDIDFGGEKFLIASLVTTDPDWCNAADFWVEGIMNDAVNDAVFERNKVISELYNCTIEVDAGGWDNGYNASVAAGDGKYALGSTSCIYSFSLGKTGNYYNILKLDVDWTKDWWDQNYILDTSTDGKLYSFVGDFSLHAMSATWIVYFNKDVYESKFSDVDIYQMVKDKQWTMDAMADMIEKIRYDANGDSDFTFSEGADADTVGMMTTAHNDRGLFFAAGLRYVTKTENTVNGSFVSALTNQPNATDVMEKLISLCNMPGYISGGYTNVRIALQNGTTLFGGEVLDVLRRMAGADKLRIGVLPLPLYDETQKDYHCYVNSQASIVVAPTSYANMQVIADFLTIFAYHSKMIVRKAYINTVKYAYTSDEDSAEMIDIILESRVYDVGYINSFATSMDGYISTMISSRKNNYTVSSEKFGAKTAEAIEEYRNAIVGIDDNY